MSLYGSDRHNDQENEEESYAHKNIKLGDILDRHAIQTWLKELYTLTHLPTAIVDNEGRILVAAGWQDICKKFHRVNPESCKNCTESDAYLTQGVSPGKYKMYKCRNHLYEAVTPIVFENKHMGNIFFGQFLLDDEPIDLELYRNQARKYGFDQNQYIAALNQVPRFNRSTVKNVMAYLSKLAYVITSEAYKSDMLVKYKKNNGVAKRK